MKNIEITNEQTLINSSFNNSFLDIKSKVTNLTIDKNIDIRLSINIVDTNKLTINLLDNSKLDILIINQNNLKYDLIVNQDRYSISNIKLISISPDTKIEGLINLNGQYSEMLLSSLVIANNNDNNTLNITTVNNAKNSSAISNSFGVASNNSNVKINFIGKINRHMNQSICEEHLKGLNRDNGKIEINPILLIDEFDVQAGHGASCGSIDNDILFYMMSRGLTKKESENMYIEGFVKPFLEEIIDENIKNDLQQKVMTKL